MTEHQLSRRTALAAAATAALFPLDAVMPSLSDAGVKGVNSQLIDLAHAWRDSQFSEGTLPFDRDAENRIIQTIREIVGTDPSVLIAPAFVAEALGPGSQLEFADLHDLWEEVIIASR